MPPANKQLLDRNTSQPDELGLNTQRVTRRETVGFVHTRVED